tara:strand:- start:129 stop:455 length:327 start_codon:yes stop_codon:yes gene_type:complete
VRARNKYGTTTTELSVTVLDVLTIDEYTDVCPRYVAGRPIPPNLPQGAKHSFERVWFHIQPCALPKASAAEHIRQPLNLCHAHLQRIRLPACLLPCFPAACFAARLPA